VQTSDEPTSLERFVHRVDEALANGEIIAPKYGGVARFPRDEIEPVCPVLTGLGTAEEDVRST